MNYKAIIIFRVLLYQLKKITSLSVYCRQHLHYLKEHKRLVCLNLLISVSLNEYLVSLGEQAENMFSRPVMEYADRQGVTERLKNKNQLLWVQKMNNIDRVYRNL